MTTPRAPRKKRTPRSRVRVHDLVRRRQRDGIWARILARLRVGAGRGGADVTGLITLEVVGVDSTVHRFYLRGRGTKAGIPVPADRVRNRLKRGSCGGRPPRFDKDDHKPRHEVECGINRLKCHRAVATRYDELDVRYEGTVLVAAINEWL